MSRRGSESNDRSYNVSQHDMFQGATDVSNDRASKLDIPKVITQTQSTPEKSQEGETDACSTGLSKMEMKILKKEQKRLRKEEKKRLKQEKKKEKKRVKKENRSRSEIDQDDLPTTRQVIPDDTSKPLEDAVYASRPLKKRKRKNDGFEKGEQEHRVQSTEQDSSDLSPNSATTNDISHDHPDESNPSGNGSTVDTNDNAGTKDDAEESEPPRKPVRRQKKRQADGKKDRATLSLSNRFSRRTWDELLEALIDFKLEHGHTNVPSRNFHDRGLAEFVVRTRNNPDELNDEQKERLRNMGFDWTTDKDKKDQAWDENLDRLDKFHKTNKNFAVHKFPEHKRLHSWLLWQRNLHRNGRLRRDRRARMEGIGYTDWTPKNKRNEDEIPKTWMKQYESLKDFFKQNGHSRVPQHKHTDDHENRTLGNWVRKQRTLRNKDCLSDKKIALLEKLDFVWNFDKESSSLRSGNLVDQRKEFDDAMELLGQYKEENGTVDDVRGEAMVGNRNIGHWISRQKSFAKKGTLSNDRRVRLEKLGVIFETAVLEEGVQI